MSFIQRLLLSSFIWGITGFLIDNSKIPKQESLILFGLISYTLGMLIQY